MASPTIAPVSVVLEDFSGSGRVATPALLGAMLRAAEKISDLIFSPGRPPQVQVYGQMIPVQVHGLAFLTADDTRHIAADLIGNNKQAMTTLREQGACDISYGLPGPGPFSREHFHSARKLRCRHARDSHRRFLNLTSLHLPAHLKEITKLPRRNRAGDRGRRVGQVFHAGGAARRASTASSTTTSSPSKTRSSSCTTTSAPPSTSASCTATRRASRWHCVPRCVRRRR